MLLSVTTDTPTRKLRNFPDFTFAEVESYAKTISGCTSTTKAYKSFAEPGYVHDIQGKDIAQLRLTGFSPKPLQVSCFLCITNQFFLIDIYDQY